MSFEIKTSNYVKPKNILIDGKEWTMTAPGAGDELMLSQSKRRADLIQKKIENGTAIEKDYDSYDQIENSMFKTFGKIFRDKTDDNHEVLTWLSSTPMSVLYAIMDDIKSQSEAEKDGSEA